MKGFNKHAAHILPKNSSNENSAFFNPCRIYAYLYKNPVSALVAIGIFIRIIYFIINLLVGGYHIDEAMLGLNAASLASTLTDAAGEKLPVYFDTWLTGGQSPLPTYLSALSVKLFGMNPTALRLPMLCISIIGFIFFCAFVCEVFTHKKERLVLTGLACVSPWLIFTSTFVLDCNYLAHMLIIAFYFMAKAINTNQTKYYAFSMIFFALGFYCYIASVLLIPVLLFTMYLTLIIKKRITYKAVAVSIITVFLVSMPFILFGLVHMEILPEFKLLGFSFSRMPFYERADTVAFSKTGLSAYLSNILLNSIFSFVYIFSNLSVVITIGLNLFLYGTFLCGLFVLLSVICFVKSLIIKNNSFTFIQKVFAISFFIGCIFFCSHINDVTGAYVYRYGILTYILLFFEGIGLFLFLNNYKKINFKKILSIYLLITLLVFNGLFFGRYIYQTKTTPDIIYGDSLFTCLDKAQKQNATQIVLIEDVLRGQNRTSVYCHYYYNYFSNTKKLINLGDEFTERFTNKNGHIAIADDDSIIFTTSDDCIYSDKNAYIIRSEETNLFQNIPDDFTVENNGAWTLIYKV